MKHKFKKICYSPKDLLKDVNTLAKFIKNVNKQSVLFPDKWDAEKYKGEAFEALIEVLIKYSSIDKRINILEYSPTQTGDMGIDGEGKSFDGKVHVVQVKFRSNPNDILTANKDHLSNFVAHSSLKYEGQLIDRTIFTTAKAINRSIDEEMYLKKVRTICLKELKALLDNNLSFWQVFLKELTE